jgi:3-(3-hydroxy-phenyl)propionate hydroxylase
MSEKNRVLIAGAGPVGFTLAYNLARRGVPCTILEGSDRIFDDPRAGTIHPPTLEMFDEIGVTPTMMERGYKVTHYQYRDRKQGVIADFELGVLESETKFPFRLMLEQHKICYILLDLLKGYADCEVLMQHRVMDVAQDSDGVTVNVEAPDGRKTFRGAYLVGCDGGRSAVRKSMDVTFDGFTYEERFLVLSTRYDFGQFGYALTNYIADPQEWCALFKVPGQDEKGMWRVVFPADAKADPKDIFEESLVQRRVQGFHKIEGDYDIVHRNLYDVHQRVASRYRDGRLLVAGDAAHINNPLGGMGMNFSTTLSIWRTSWSGCWMARAKICSIFMIVSGARWRRNISSARPSRTSATSSRRTASRRRRSTTSCAPSTRTRASCSPISCASP